MLSVPRVLDGTQVQKLTTRDPEIFGFADSHCYRWHGRFVARILWALADELSLTL
jgi:hypothetical protein